MEPVGCIKHSTGKYMKLVLNLTENESDLLMWAFFHKNYLEIGKLIYKLILKMYE